MKAYLLTAAGVIFLSVIASLLVPEGKLNKSVSFVMRLICIFVLVQPITGVFKINSTEAVSDFYDYEYLSGVYSRHQSEELEKLLAEEFQASIDCTAEVTYDEYGFKVVSVSVALDDKNKNLIDEIYAYLRELGYINITVYAKSA